MWYVLVVVLSLFSSGHQDSLEISSKDGEPLEFPSFKYCSNYIEENIIPLLEYSHLHYPEEYGPRVIVCVKKQKGIEL